MKTIILIATYAYFLCLHLCDRVINEFLCVDNIFTGSKAKIAHLTGIPYIDLMRGFVIQPKGSCYVDELIEVLVRLMNTETGLTWSINPDSSNKCSILELTEKVFLLGRRKLKFVFHPLPTDDPTRRQPKEKLECNLRVLLEDGLKKNIRRPLNA